MNEGVTKFLRKTFFRKKDTNDNSNHATSRPQQRHSFSDAGDFQHIASAPHDGHRKQFFSDKHKPPLYTPAPPILQSTTRGAVSPRSLSTNTFNLANEQSIEEEEEDIGSVYTTKTDLTQEDRKCLAKEAERPSTSRYADYLIRAAYWRICLCIASTFSPRCI